MAKKHLSKRDDEKERTNGQSKEQKQSSKTAPPSSKGGANSSPIAAKKDPPKPAGPTRVPSPPPGPPSGLAEAMARLADATAQMEFAYAKQLKLRREQEVVRAKIEVLEKLPVGADAYREDLERLTAAEVDEEVKKISAT